MGLIVVVDNTHGQRVLQFFPKLLEYLDLKGKAYIVINGNHEGQEPLLTMDIANIDGIILSGSPIMLPELFPKVSHLKSALATNQIITNIECINKFSNKVPILGICFGCQLMNIMGGGTLSNVGGDKVLCKAMNIQSRLRAKFCCKYMPNKLANAFTTRMTVDIDGKTYPCLIKHKRKRMWGCMFHPEALKSTYFILDRFIDTCNMQNT
jgi:gamma-glutamyl-gamma-aminobutyrate hydrolase PuuD